VEIVNDVKVEEISPEVLRLSDGRTIPVRTTV
jgi:hypothetical protein